MVLRYEESGNEESKEQSLRHGSTLLTREPTDSVIGLNMSLDGLRAISRRELCDERSAADVPTEVRQST